ncbi:hypothetical protein BRC81_03935 [Halobacteriales archaeon QS_1_68_20]|nr:MAG: hypothetical protein BRC81_03935 [Halobacteriales archaeon QS_1_68_20]
MSDFDLDLESAEERMDGDWSTEDSVELGVLDGTTPPYEWIEAVEGGSILVLAVEGDAEELAAGFAREVREMGGDLLTFRGKLIVTPPEVSIDHDRLG